MDIVELCPKYDMNDITASLAARLLSESVASIRSAYLTESGEYFLKKKNGYQSIGFSGTF